MAELDALAAEATVDCYNEEEQVTGFFVMIADNLAVPFETTVLGVTVTVEKINQTASGFVGWGSRTELAPTDSAASASYEHVDGQGAGSHVGAAAYKRDIMGYQLGGSDDRHADPRRAR
ncbi:MAG TPA: hypothetical protein VHZ03_07565 [Trebonia sp.]|nr:hypothetical protein [Trebonia sp.]